MFKKVIFTVCLIMFGYAALAQSAILLDRVIAIVNKEVITWGELYRAMEFESPEAVKAMKGEERRKFFRDNEITFLENLIEMKLKLQEAARTGIAASDEDINRAIDGIKRKHSMTEEMFKEAIKREGFTLSEYKKRLSEQITVSRIVEHEVRSRIVVTEREIDKYLNENKDIAKEMEGFHISHIFLKRTADRKQVEEKAQQLHKKAAAGEDFSKIAMEHSDDATARVGGDMGFVKRTDLSKIFLDVLSKIKTGDVSDPFWSDAGIHILKVHEARIFKSPEELRESVRQRMIEERFAREYKNWMKGLKERAYIEVKL